MWQITAYSTVNGILYELHNLIYENLNNNHKNYIKKINPISWKKNFTRRAHLPVRQLRSDNDSMIAPASSVKWPWA